MLYYSSTKYVRMHVCTYMRCLHKCVVSSSTMLQNSDYTILLYYISLIDEDPL